MISINFFGFFLVLSFSFIIFIFISSSFEIR